MPFNSGIFNADGVQPPPGTAAEIVDAHLTLLKLLKCQYAAGTLDLAQINGQLFPFLKLEFLPPNWKPADESEGFSVPEESTAVAIYPLDGNPLPMELKKALVDSMSPEEAEEFAQMISLGHFKQEEASVGMDADLAEGPTTPQPSRSLSPVSSSTASSWVHVHQDGETDIEPHSSNARTQDPPSSPPTLVLDDYAGQEIEILEGTATDYANRMQRTCDEPQAQHDTESASSSTTYAESLYPQPPNSPIRDAPSSPSTWGSAAGEMDVDSLASDHDEDEDDIDSLCSPRDPASRVRAVVYPAIQQYKKNNEPKLAKTLDALFMQGISHNFVLRFLDAVCSEKATVQQYADIKTCLHFNYAKMRMDEAWKRATSYRSMFASMYEEEPEIKKTKFGLTQLRQVMVEFGTESQALDFFEAKDYDVDDSDGDSDREFPHKAIDELVAHRSKSF